MIMTEIRIWRRMSGSNKSGGVLGSGHTWPKTRKPVSDADAHPLGHRVSWSWECRGRRHGPSV